VNAFRAKGRKYFETKVPKQPAGGGKVVWVKLPTGTMDPRTAKDMDKMIAALGPSGAHAWDVLEAVTGTPQRWTLSEMFGRWSVVPSTKTDKNGRAIPPSAHERIEALREQLHDVDLEPLVETFYKVLTGPSGGVGVDTADHYRGAVRLLIPEGTPFFRSEFTERDLRIWIEEMDDVQPGTVRKRGMGMRRFAAWLVGRQVLGSDPMRDVPLPPAGDPLSHYIDVADVVRLADSQSGQMRLLEYVLPATALEVSTALAVRVRAVSLLDKEIHAPGTKAYSRNRIVRVAEFGWDAVRELVKGKHPDTRLFDLIPHRYYARDEHHAAAVALGEKDHRVFVEWNGVPKIYTLRDHRHTWAVRAVKSGWPIGAVATQLGHVDGVLALKVYGKHEPKQEERDRYEGRSHARDQEIAAAAERQKEEAK
jgi:integrase